MVDQEKELVAIDAGDKSYVSITWQVSDFCNFRCSYCNEGNWGAKFKNENGDQYLRIIDKMVRHFQDQGYKRFKFFFSGGEPTIWKPLHKICDYIYSNTEEPIVAVNTNFSRSLDWWKKNYHLFTDIVASFHVEFCNKDRYLETGRFLQDKIPYLCYRMLMHDDRFEEVVEFSKRIKTELDNYRIEYAPLLAELTPHSVKHLYSEPWKQEFLNSHSYEMDLPLPIEKKSNGIGHYTRYSDGSYEGLNANRVISRGQNRFKGWQCRLTESIFINPTGTITLASCGVGGVVGNINDSDINISSKAVTCPHSVCNCGTDIGITKFNPKKVHLTEKGAALNG